MEWINVEACVGLMGQLTGFERLFSLNHLLFLSTLIKQPTVWWGVVGFFGLVAAMVAIAQWTGSREQIILLWRKCFTSAKAEIAEAQQQQIRQQLLEIVKTLVSRRLDDSFHRRVQNNIEGDDQHQQAGGSQSTSESERAALSYGEGLTHRWWHALPQHQPQSDPLPSDPSQPSRSHPIPSSAPTLDWFDRTDISGRLLIVGDSGSGKTTELLRLAHDLLNRAQEANQTFIPVIFELSAWNVESTLEQPLSGWLCDQLEQQYQVSPETTQRWIETQQLVPLFDGLDNLDRAQQQHCMKAIAQWLSTYPAMQAVVCCQSREDALESIASHPFYGAIELRPLTREQIKDYVTHVNRSQLWLSLEATPELEAIARSPLGLTLLVLTLASPQDQGQSIHPAQEVTVQDVVDAYIDQQLHDPNSQGAYPPHKAPSPRQTQRYLGWLATHMQSHHNVEFLIEHLQPTALTSPFQKMTYRLLDALSNGLIYGLISGLIYGMNGGWIFGLGIGLASGFIDNLTIGPIGSIVKFETDLCQAKFPNQGIRESLRSGLISGLIGGLIGGWLGGLIGGWLGRLPDGLVVGSLIGGLMGGIIGGIIGGLGVAMKHCILRLVLYRSGHAPWNYARFLDHAVQHGFMQRVGGRYRFMHDRLRKQFATRYRSL
ncbi:MAG: NACHT domain-containing protein [Elainellaceae cyanobacterium]